MLSFTTRLLFYNFFFFLFQLFCIFWFLIENDFKLFLTESQKSKTCLLFNFFFDHWLDKELKHKTRNSQYLWTQLIGVTIISICSVSDKLRERFDALTWNIWKIKIFEIVFSFLLSANRLLTSKKILPLPKNRLKQSYTCEKDNILTFIISYRFAASVSRSQYCSFSMAQFFSFFLI